VKTNEWFALLAGAALGVGACWLHDKYLVIDYRIGQLEGPTTSRTGAEGSEVEQDCEENVRGSIGFVGSGEKWREAQ